VNTIIEETQREGFGIKQPNDDEVGGGETKTKPDYGDNCPYG
jgi:hypothetical protein